MNRLCYVVAAMLLSVSGFCQIPDKPVGGSGDALGQTYIALNNSWAAIKNNAALGWDTTYWVGVHHQNRFMLSELGLSSIAARLPVRPGAFGVSLSHTGYNQFNVTRADISYGMKLSDRFVAGVGFSYHHAQLTGEYSNRNAFTVSAGLQYFISKKLLIGAFLFNPARASIDEQQTMPPLLGVALTYLPSKEVLVTLQVDDDTETPTAIRAGVEYKPIEVFALRLGYSSGNTEGLTAGIGLNLKGFWADLSVNKHSVLGYTPLLSVAYQFK